MPQPSQGNTRWRDVGEQRQTGGVNVDKGGWKVGECMSEQVGGWVQVEQGPTPSPIFFFFYT